MNTRGAALVLGLLYLWPIVAGTGAVKKMNPYTGQAQAIQDGKALYDRYGCAACHGMEGGGGQSPAILDDA